MVTEHRPDLRFSRRFLVDSIDTIPPARPSVPQHSSEMSSSVPTGLANVTISQMLYVEGTSSPLLFSSFELIVIMDS